MAQEAPTDSELKGEYQDRSRPSLLGQEDQLRAFKAWFKQDKNHSADWRTQAKEDFDFISGRQWSSEDQSVLKDQNRPAIVFNRALSVIKAVAGVEINGRHETRFIPRGNEDAKVNEVLTAASQWMSDQCDAEDEQSEAFQHALICGMGWTEGRLDTDENPEAEYVEESIDPMEMYWDRSARKKNLSDARRIWRVRKISCDDARSMFPGVPEEKLDAKWASGTETNDGQSKEDREKRDEENDIGYTEKDVTLVQIQWFEKEPYIKAADPFTGEVVDLDEETFKSVNDKVTKLGGVVRHVKLHRKVLMQAFIGDEVLEVTVAPCKDKFSFNCITGEPDKNEGTWFGLVRVMMDPQRWANKWMSQTLHILNSTAKGGILAEQDAFANQAQAEQSYAKPQAITWLTKGALSGGKPKVMEKPGTGIPTGFFQLMEFAISSIRDVTGINLELMGLRDANQPGILEAQRKQAAMTILATMFDSLRRFRKRVGRVRLYFIQNNLSDGRMIRIVGEEGAKSVPLAKDRTTGEYDVIVDDAPTSPNQKEANWAIIGPMLPLFKDMMTPDVAVQVLEYSPLPPALVDKLKEMVNKPNPEAEEQKKIVDAAAKTKIKRDDAAAEKDLATAEKIAAEIPGLKVDAMKEALTPIPDHAPGKMANGQAHHA